MSQDTRHDAYRTPGAKVHETLSRYMLADGYPLVFDYDRSKGARLYDETRGETFIDFFSFFASQPLGFNHPGMADEDFLERLHEAALCKPVNSDVYTRAMADFVETFAETTIPATHRDHLFFIEGGGLAVENALKAAFDWKYRKNAESGGPDTENLEVLHFRHAFHGRTGYTLSLTNTNDPRKFQYFPRFDWPRIDPPECRFPLDDANLADVKVREETALKSVRKAIADRGGRIAAIIVETIMAEGGDKHFRPEFLQALRAIADEDEIILIFDEVQAGMGLTGSWWAFEQMGCAPDVFAFGKKTQVCGIAASHRFDEIDSVFKVSSRINSTWGGNLVDMVRSERYVQIIDGEDLLANARAVGARVLTELEGLQERHDSITNVRGKGLMIAFDMPDEEQRDAMLSRLFDARVIMLSCGDRSIRFRPVLDLDVDTALEGVGHIASCLP